MEIRDVAVGVGGLAITAFLVAMARVTEEDKIQLRERNYRKWHGDGPQWTDKNRWE